MKNKWRWLIKIGVGVLVFILVAFVVCWVLTSGTYTVRQTLPFDPSLPRITLNGYTFHTETFGKAANPVVIVLHGGPGADYRYLYPLKKLADHYFVVFYDQRGTGLSPRVPAEQISLQVYYQDVDAFVNYFGKGRPVYIIGHSWGAMLASGYACLNPHKIKKLVLAEPGFLRAEMAGPATQTRFNLALMYGMGKSWFQSLHVSNKTDPYAAKDYFFGRLLTIVNPDYYCKKKPQPQKNKKRRGGLSWRAGYVCWETLAGRMMRDEHYRLSLDFTIGVEHFNKKVLFLAGQCNQIIGEPLQRQQMKYFPSAQLVVIPEAGHDMFNDQPDLSLKIIRHYFAEK